MLSVARREGQDQQIQVRQLFSFAHHGSLTPNSVGERKKLELSQRRVL